MLKTVESTELAFGLNMANGEHTFPERDREVFHPKNGLSWYEGQKALDLEGLYPDLWLPEHSLALVDKLNQHGGITLIGEVGAGKSTLLYGARAIMRAQGIPYVNINGHFTSTGTEEVLQAIDKTEDGGATIVYDSADYLVGGSRKIRSFPLERHIPRSLDIMRRLIEFRQRGGNLLLSSHHQDWIDDRAHPKLKPTWEELQEHTIPEVIDISLPTPEQRIRLLVKMGLEPDIATFIAELPDDPGFLDHILDRWGNSDYIDWTKQKLTNYQILKLMVKDQYRENDTVLDTINRTVNGLQTPEDSWDAVLDFTYSKTYLLTFFTKLR